jgi:acetyl esterase/lipase
MEPIRYGYGPDPSQYAELYLPAEARRAVVVIVHGGYWRARHTAELGAPAARDLAARGWACWNLEYRRAGNGGGWPGTFEDVGAGIDALAGAAAEHGLALDSVIGLGHSAGGQLTAWAAGRGGLPAGSPGADPAVPLSAVLSQAGVLDLRRAWELGLSDQAVRNFLGFDPEDEQGRFALADPMCRLPLPVPFYAFHGRQDEAVPFELSERYVAAARAAGGRAELVPVPGGHMDLIDPASAAFESVRRVLGRLAPGPA